VYNTRKKVSVRAQEREVHLKNIIIFTKIGFLNTKKTSGEQKIINTIIFSIKYQKTGFVNKHKWHKRVNLRSLKTQFPSFNLRDWPTKICIYVREWGPVFLAVKKIFEIQFNWKFDLICVCVNLKNEIWWFNINNSKFFFRPMKWTQPKKCNDKLTDKRKQSFEQNLLQARKVPNRTTFFQIYCCCCCCCCCCCFKVLLNCHLVR